MGISNRAIDIENVTLEKTQEFYEWLKGGDNPKGIEFSSNPNLTAEQAFSVIYYLQEQLEIIPDNYEKCKKCNDLYDSESEGTCIDEESTVIDEDGDEVDANYPEEMYGRYCDNCRPD